MTPSARPPVTVVGAGYVGLVTAVGLAGLGRDVRLVEVAPARLQSLRDGRIPIHEDGLQDGFQAAAANGRLTVDGALPDELGIVLVCVGTPIGDEGTSDLRHLDAALEELRPRLGPHDIVVIRSTLPVGDTRRAVEAAGLPTARVFTNPEFLRRARPSDFSIEPVVIGRPEGAPGRRGESPSRSSGGASSTSTAGIIKSAAIRSALNLSSPTSSPRFAGRPAPTRVSQGSARIRRIGRTCSTRAGHGGGCRGAATAAVAGRALGCDARPTAASAINGAAQALRRSCPSWPAACPGGPWAC
jgi:hypothetical protein